MATTNTALRYLSYGWSVVPVHVPTRGGSCSCGREDCEYPGKHARVRWSEFTKRLPTEDEVREWFDSSCYGSNIGVITGRVSQLVVIDVDNPLIKSRPYGLPETLSARTGGGGRHYFYRCAKQIRGHSENGVDIKAEGGFVVLPPSVHYSGRQYSWRHKMPPAKLDPELLPSATDYSRHVNGDKDWYTEVLQGVSEGDRSNASAKLAGRYVSAHLSEEECYMLLSVWNERNDPPLTDTDIRKTVRWAYSKRSEAIAAGTITTFGQLADLLDRVRKGGR